MIRALWVSGGVTLCFWWLAALTRDHVPLVELGAELEVALECPGLSATHLQRVGAQSSTRVWWSCHARPLGSHSALHSADLKRARSPLGAHWYPVIAVFDLTQRDSSLMLFRIPSMADEGSTASTHDRYEERPVEVWDSHGVAAHPTQDRWVYLHRLAGEQRFSILGPRPRSSQRVNPRRGWRDAEIFMNLSPQESPLGLSGDADGWRLWVRSADGGLTQYRGAWEIAERVEMIQADQVKIRAGLRVETKRYPPPASDARAIAILITTESAEGARVLWSRPESLSLGSPLDLGAELPLAEGQLERVSRASALDESLFSESGVRPWLVHDAPPWTLSDVRATEVRVDTSALNALPSPHQCLQVEETQVHAWGALSAQESPHLIKISQPHHSLLSASSTWRFAPRVHYPSERDPLARVRTNTTARLSCVWRPNQHEWLAVRSRGSAPRWFPTPGQRGGVWINERGQIARAIPERDVIKHIEAALERRAAQQATSLSSSWGARPSAWRLIINISAWWSLRGGWLWLGAIAYLVTWRRRRRSQVSTSAQSTLLMALTDATLTTLALSSVALHLISMISTLSPLAYIAVIP